MRVFFTIQPGYGHFHPLVPIARALEEAAHDVAFTTTPYFCPTIEANGFQSFPAGLLNPDEELPIQEQAAAIPGPERAAFIWINIFAGIRAERSLPDLLPVMRKWRPDVLVRDMTEFAGCVAAEHLGIPHAAVQV